MPGSKMDQLLRVIARHPDGVLVSTARAAVGMGEGGYDRQIRLAEEAGLITIDRSRERASRAYPGFYDPAEPADEPDFCHRTVKASEAPSLTGLGPASVFDLGRR